MWRAFPLSCVALYLRPKPHPEDSVPISQEDLEVLCLNFVVRENAANFVELLARLQAPPLRTAHLEG